MRPLIAGNWKMNGRRGEAEALARALCEGVAQAPPACDLVVCPPFTALAAVAAVLAASDGGAAIGLGAQDCHAESAGAHTGDIAPAMLTDLGVKWVILGHSERRRDHGEIDEGVRQKVEAARHAGLIPIVCVGESDEQRSAGRETEVVGWQIEGSLPKDFAAGEGVIAYEPCWAIGTGKTPSEEQVAAMHAFIREELRRQFGEAGDGVRILYGGSVKPDNAAALLGLPEVAGALIGGASLKAEEFLAIARARLANQTASG